MGFWIYHVQYHCDLPYTDTDTQYFPCSLVNFPLQSTICQHLPVKMVLDMVYRWHPLTICHLPLGSTNIKKPPILTMQHLLYPWKPGTVPTSPGAASSRPLRLITFGWAFTKRMPKPRARAVPLLGRPKNPLGWSRNGSYEPVVICMVLSAMTSDK